MNRFYSVVAAVLFLWNVALVGLLFVLDGPPRFLAGPLLAAAVYFAFETRRLWRKANGDARSRPRLGGFEATR